MSSTASTKDQNQRRLEHEIRGMISTLTRHLMSLGKSSGRQAEEMPDNGPRVIKLAGENKGTTMKAMDWDDVFDARSGDERASAITNSNYQAVNNSILIGGSYTAEDPGVHIEISYYAEDDNVGEKHMTEKEKLKKQEDDREEEEEEEEKKKKKEEEKKEDDRAKEEMKEKVKEHVGRKEKAT